MTIHHVGIAVSDRDGAERAFYAPLLGGLGYARQASHGPVTVWRHRPGHAVHLLEGEVVVHRSDDVRAPVDHPAFRADSRATIDRIHRDLVRLGTEIVGPPREIPQFGPGCYAMFVRDPEGRLVELVHD